MTLDSSPSVLVTPQRCVPIVDEETEEDIVFADINNSPVNGKSEMKSNNRIMS